MSRRIEITVPNDWAEAVRNCLEDENKCGLGDHSEKLNMYVELPGYDKTVFLVTVPGAGVGPALEALRKNGFGVKVGRIVINSLEFMKPDLSKPLIPLDLLPEEDRARFRKKKAGMKGVAQFIKARKTTEELFAEISNNANMTINTWLNLIGASIMAAGGLATGATVFVVAAMLVSPIMGPILGMTFGYRVADWPLFKAGFYNEVKMVATCFFCGLFCGFVLGAVGDTYNWPTSAMLTKGQGYQLIISIIVSAAAGMVLAVSLSSPATNALVGTAISAGLLPPLVNCGMLISYSMTYAPKDQKYNYYEMGTYSFLFYLSHVFTIIIVANLVFWLKDIDPRFRQGDDANFDDIASLREHKEKMKALGQDNATAGEKVKLKNFLTHAMHDLKVDATDGLLDLKDSAFGAMSRVKGVFTGDQNNRNRTVSSSSQYPSGQSSHQTGQDYDIENPESNQTNDDGVHTNSQALLFKRHKVQTSPNILAEQEFEESISISAVLPQQNTGAVSGSTGLSRRRPSSLTTASAGINRQGYTSLQPVPEGVEESNTHNTSQSMNFNNNNYNDNDPSHVINPLHRQQEQQQYVVSSSPSIPIHSSQSSEQLLPLRKQNQRDDDEYIL